MRNQIISIIFCGPDLVFVLQHLKGPVGAQAENCWERGREEGINHCQNSGAKVRGGSLI